MKLFLTTAALTATLISGMAFASDPVIPWATNSGGNGKYAYCGNGRGFECAASADHPHA